MRCQRSLGLTSVKRGDHWYGSVACAEGRSCPFDDHAPAVPEPALYSRPRRFFAKREPKELNRREEELQDATGDRDRAAALARASSPLAR